MKTTQVGLVGIIAIAALTFTACATEQPTEDKSEDVAPVAAPEETEDAQAEPAAPEGTRESPIPYGESYTFAEIGEAGGDAWTVTIHEPADVTQAIIDEAIALYDGDEEYVKHSRPEDGTMFLGVTGTVERLLEHPEDPGFALSVDVISSDGHTINAYGPSLDASPALMDLDEMYAPATADFTEVLTAPEGTTGQVLVTLNNTGERIYFGDSAIEAPEGYADTLAASWEDLDDATRADVTSQWSQVRDTEQEPYFLNYVVTTFEDAGVYVTSEEARDFLESVTT